MKRLIPLFFALTLALSGCGGAKPSAPTASSTDISAASPALQPVDVVLDWYPNALHAFLYTAIEKGYFAQEGLEVTLRFPSNANDALSLVAAGRAQIGLYYQQDLILARANQSVPVKSIAAVVQSPLNIVLSLKENKILSPTDLIGKTVGYAGTELSEAMVRSMMDHVGADTSDLTLIDVGFDLMSAMTTKQVDATIGCLLNHEVPQMQEQGFAVNYFELGDYGVPSYYEAVFLANDTLIAEQPELLRGFLRACEKGFADQKTNPEESLSILLQHQNAENFPLSETVERQSLNTLFPLMENNTVSFLAQSEEMWQNNIEWLYTQGLIEQKPAVTDVMANLG